MTQLYTAPSGVIGVELGPNNKVYFTTQDTIYTYDLPATPAGKARNATDTTLVILFIVAIIAVALLMVYTGLRYRRKVNANARTGRYAEA